MIAADQPGGLFRGREQHPTVEALLTCQPLEELGLLGFGTRRPMQSTTRVPRETGEHVTGLRHPHRDAAPAETPDDPEASIVTTDDERASVDHRASHRVSRRAANPLPATKRMSGPKLHAAGAPTTWRPGMVVSKPLDNRG